MVDGDGKVRDIDATTVYTFEDCMEACLTYNDDLGGRGTKCEAVTYNANLTSIFGGEKFGNCFLKDNAGKGSQATAEVASAILVR